MQPPRATAATIRQPPAERCARNNLPAGYESDYAAAHGREFRNYRQADWHARMCRWAAGALRGRDVRQGEHVIMRSVPQIVTGMGLDYDGTVRDARDRYRNQIGAVLDCWVAMGYLSSWEAVVAANGEGEGIRLHFTPRGCSSVG